MFAISSMLAAALPEGLDSAEAERVIVGLLAVCVIAVVFVVRTVQKLATRALLVVLLAAVGVGLWIQRANLQDCAGQCECHLFGQDVDVPDPNGFCPQI